MRLLLALLIATPGCAVLRDRARHPDATTSVALSGAIAADGDFAGGALVGRGGAAGMELQLEVDVPRLTRDADPRRFTGGGVGIGLRLSPLGLLAKDHTVDRYFDFGAQAGVLGGPIERPAGATTYGMAWFGGWVELGLPGMVHGRHIAVVGEVRREVITTPWVDETVFLIGLAWARREPAGDDDFMPFLK